MSNRTPKEWPRHYPLNLKDKLKRDDVLSKVETIADNLGECILQVSVPTKTRQYNNREYYVHKGGRVTVRDIHCLENLKTKLREINLIFPF